MPLIFSNPSIFLLCAQGTDLREPVDERVVQKIREMQVIGVRSVAEVRRHLEKFVKDELFITVRSSQLRQADVTTQQMSTYGTYYMCPGQANEGLRMTK